MTIKVCLPDGWVFRTLAAGASAAPISSIQAGPLPYDPTAGPLTLSQGTWSFAYDGKDGQGYPLLNGAYLVIIESRQGPSLTTLHWTFTVVASVGSTPLLQIAPNPVKMGGTVALNWNPATAQVLVQVYALDGELVRDLGICSPPVLWTVSRQGGLPLPPGIYVISLRPAGQRNGALFKLAITP